MKEYNKTEYTSIELSKELLNSFAKALLPEIRNFYASDYGKEYYIKWLSKHPEYIHSQTSDCPHI